MWRTLCLRFGSLCETNIVPRNSKHHLLGIRVFQFRLQLRAKGDADVRASRQAATASWARGLPGFQYVNNITDFPKALGNSATIVGVGRCPQRLRALLELRLCLASFPRQDGFRVQATPSSLRATLLCVRSTTLLSSHERM
jgi:hypothetical protein